MRLVLKHFNKSFTFGKTVVRYRLLLTVQAPVFVIIFLPNSWAGFEFLSPLPLWSDLNSKMFFGFS